MLVSLELDIKDVAEGVNCTYWIQAAANESVSLNFDSLDSDRLVTVRPSLCPYFFHRLF